MKKNEKIIITACILLLAIIVLLTLVIKNNKNTILKCSSLTNNIEIKFDGNKPVYVSGIIKLKGVKDMTNIKDSMETFNNIFVLDEDKKTIEYSFKYDEANSNPLNKVGLNYDSKAKYKSIKKQLEGNNYYCK